MKIQNKHHKTAEKVLLNEANAIRDVINCLDDDFSESVQKIYENSGRVVVTGIGKSAIIANKIVATFNSTGTPAIFLHAADAIHGDLGMVMANDVVICISKSGNSPEIKVLVPLLKRRGSLLIALVSSNTSFLAKEADLVIWAKVEAEACPNNLAPTTSTTVHMAVGDALAVCLLEMRGFSPQDFAQVHPGGSLGKQLYLKVDDIVKQNECPIVYADDEIKQVIFQISSKRLGATAVIDENEILVGIVTDGDVRRMLENHNEIGTLTAEQIMTKNPKVAQIGDYAVQALKDMQKSNITQLIVVENEKVIGFVHLHDLLKEGIA